MRKTRDKNKTRNTAPAWLVTYSDLVTLLLCFFVLLYAFSTLDVQKFQSVLHSFRSALGVLDGGMTISREKEVMGGTQLERDWRQLGVIQDELINFIDAQGISEDIRITEEYRGLKVSFSGRLLFELGKDDLTEEAKELVSQVSEILKRWPNPIRIEGHTDDLPINTEQFPSNWELSVARAVRVLRYLIEERNMDPKRLSAIGYGQYWPLVPNTSDENRALNRRVDIVILRLSLAETEPGYSQQKDLINKKGSSKNAR